MTLKELEAYRNSIVEDAALRRRLADAGSYRLHAESVAIQRARAVLCMCYISRAEAKAAGLPQTYNRFVGVPRPPVKVRT